MPAHGQMTHTRVLTKMRTPVRTPARPLAATGRARGAADVGRYQCPPPLCALRGSEKPPCAAVRAGYRGRVGLGQQPDITHHACPVRPRMQTPAALPPTSHVEPET